MDSCYSRLYIPPQVIYQMGINSLTTRNMKVSSATTLYYFHIVTLGFLHSRTNLSPFTKDFRGEDQFDEYLTIFLRSRFGGTFLAKQNWCLQPEFWKHLFKTALSIERKICAVKKLRKLIQIRFRILFLYLKPQV